ETEGRDGGPGHATIAFVARDVPAVGHRTFRLLPTDHAGQADGWSPLEGNRIENEAFAVVVDPARGGAITSLVEKRTGKELIQAGKAANALVAYREYPNHPHFGEGPWHLTPDGRAESSEAGPATVLAEQSAVGRRIRVASPFQGGTRRQEIILLIDIVRVNYLTRTDTYA